MSKTKYFMEASFTPNKELTKTYLNLRLVTLNESNLKTLRAKTQINSVDSAISLLSMSVFNKFYNHIQLIIELELERTKRYSKYLYDFKYKNQEFKSRTYGQAKKDLLMYLTKYIQDQFSIILTKISAKQ